MYNFANANELLFDDWSGSNSQSLAQKRIAMNNDGNKDNSLYKKNVSSLLILIMIGWIVFVMG